jgi:hypothetical protein
MMSNHKPFDMSKKIIFRTVLVYFLIQVLPIDPDFWRTLFGANGGPFSLAGIFVIAHYIPGFGHPPGIWPDWVLFGIVAAGAAAIWTLAENRQRESAGGSLPAADYIRDETALYRVRTLVRYRLALAIFGYGFVTLFPLLSPYPSISNLNTNYGDFTRWKLFSLSLGVVPGYESFLGLVEIIGALLLLYRRSASIGAFILSIFLGNVFMSNWAYGGGDTVYSLYLITLALFVVAFDAQRLANLLFFQRPAAPATFRPVFALSWQRGARVVLKAAFVFVFVFLYGFEARHTASYQFPSTKGLPDAKGVYNVAVFKKGRDSIGYSRTDSTRWQDLVFEDWATISIRSNRPVVLDSVNIERPGLVDGERDYELQGSAGRHYYRYTLDTIQRVLTLQNKNPHDPDDRLVLHYDRPDAGRIVLSGVDQGRDSVYAVLERRDKKYLLEEARKAGRQKGLKL